MTGLLLAAIALALGVLLCWGAVAFPGVAAVILGAMVLGWSVFLATLLRGIR